MSLALFSVNMFIPRVNFIFLQIYKNFNTGKKSRGIYWMSYTYPNKGSMRNKEAFQFLVPVYSLTSHFYSIYHLLHFSSICRNILESFHHSNYTHVTTNDINRFFSSNPDFHWCSLKTIKFPNVFSTLISMTIK